jgi:hypothetical protein
MGIGVQCDGKSGPLALKDESCTKIMDTSERVRCRKNTTYKRQLQLLRGIRVLDDELAERLSNTMSSSFLRNFIKVIIRQIKLVPNGASIRA